LDRGRLLRHVGNVPGRKMRELDDGLRLVLALGGEAAARREPGAPGIRR
jgi:hypothetical protein